MSRSAGRPYRSNEAVILLETVQTSTPWRPQLPLPKEVTPQQMDTTQPYSTSASAKKDTRKWSIGNLFRKKKKDSDSDTSSEEDRKAGFNPPSKRKEKRKRASNLGNTFDHIVVRPSSNEGRKVEHSSATPEGYIITGANKTGSLDRRLRRQKLQSARLEVPIINSSSGEDGSHKSSTMSRFKSDESLGNHSGNSSSRRTRAARTERYMKRVNRDDDGHSPIVTNQPVGRWHTQPVPQNLMHGSANSINHGIYQPDMRLQQGNGLRNSASLTNMPMNSGFVAYGAPVNNLNQPTMSYYENHPRPFNHTLPYTNFPPTPGMTRDQITSPPPIPPRDASRRLTVQNGNDMRPMSYAFDTTASALSGSNFAVNGKCVSQDQIWNTNYNLTPTQPAQPQQRRFISRHPNTTNIFTTPNTVDDTRSRRAHFAKNRQSSHETILYQQKQPYNMGYANSKPFTKTSPPLSAFKPTQDFRYVTDITPRSRRPIHILVDNKTEAELLDEAGKVPAPRPVQKPETTTQLLANAVQGQKGGKPTTSASEFWKKIDQELATNRQSRTHDRQSSVKPRSVSSSRALDIANQRNEKLNHELDCLMGRSNYRNRRFANMGVDEVDSDIVTAKLCIARIDNPEEQPANMKPTPEVVENVSKKLSPTNKYEEHVVKNVSQATVEPSYHRSPSQNDAEKVEPPPVNTASMPRKQKSPFDTLRAVAKQEVVKAEVNTPQKGRNLDEAINELEAIYKSLKFNDEEILERATRKDQSTPTFEDRQLEYDDEDEENRKEPDVVLDDLSYRNIKHANSALKVLENQPPFGIPIGPVVPSPNTDYLQVAKPKSDKPRFMPQKTPDLIADDLAVRNLRKDSDQLRSQNEKKRAYRSLSANIQSLLVQKESAKPSGGDFDEFEFFMAKQRQGEVEPDVPSTVYALPVIEPQPQKPAMKKTSSSSPAENRGAIYNLPATIKSPPPSDSKSRTASPTSKRNSRLSLPKSVSPDVVKSASRDQMEDILNAIALEAKVTSEKLGKDLIALRKETISGPKLEEIKTPIVKPSPIKPFGDLVLEKPNKAPSMKMTDEIDEVAKAAKLCEDILKNVVEEKQRARRKSPSPARRLVREIEHASQAAKECEKILQDVIDNKPRSSDQVEIANLMKNKEPLEAQKAVHKKLTLDLIAADRERTKEASKSPIVSKPETPSVKEAIKLCEKLIVTRSAPVATPDSDEAEIANLMKENEPYEAQKAVHKKLSLDMKVAVREREKLEEVIKSPVQRVGPKTPVFEAKSPVLKLTLKTETYTFEIPEKKPIEEMVKPKVIAARQKSNSLEHIEEIGPDYDNLRSDFEKNIAKPLKSLQPLPAELPDYDNLQSRSVKSSSPTAEVVKTTYPAPPKQDDEIDQIMKEYALKAECQNFNEAICNKIGEKLKHAILNNTSCTDDDKQMNMIELASKTSSSLDLSDTKTTPYSTPKETFSPQLKSPRSQTPAAAFNALLTQTARPSQNSEKESPEIKTTVEPKLRAVPVVAPQIEFIDTADESLYNSAEELAMIFGSKAGTPPRNAAAKGKSKDSSVCGDASACPIIPSTAEHGYINIKNTKISLYNNLLTDPHWQERNVKSVHNLDTIVETHEEFVDFDCNNDDSCMNNLSISNNNNEESNLNSTKLVSGSTSSRGSPHSNTHLSDSDDMSLFRPRHQELHDNNDSGNVSLSDFVDYAVDDDAVFCGKRYPAKEAPVEVVNIDSLLTDEDQRNSMSMMDEFDEIYAQCGEVLDEQFDDDLFEDILNDEEHVDQVGRCRQRRSLRTDDEQSSSPSPPPRRTTISTFFSTTTTTTGTVSSKSFLGLRNRNLLQPQHVILACSYGMANYDYLTLLAIIIAIITLFALLLL